MQAINNGNVASAFTTCTHNPLCSVEDIETVATARVYAFGGNIYVVNNGDATNYAIYAINGVQVAAGNVAANATETVNTLQGIYIVKVGAQVVKVVL